MGYALPSLENLGQTATFLWRALATKAVPGFRDDHGVAGILRVVFDGGKQAEAATVQVNPLAKAGDILGAVVFDARDFVLVDEELVEEWIFARTELGIRLLHVEHVAVGNASHSIEEFAALALNVIRRHLFSARYEVDDQADGDASQKY